MLTVAEQNTTLYKRGGDDNPTKQYRLEIVLVLMHLLKSFMAFNHYYKQIKAIAPMLG